MNPDLKLVQFAESARDDPVYFPSSGKHDFDAQYAIQKAFSTNSFDDMPDYDAVVRFIRPDDTECYSEHGPSHRFFVYRKDGSISTGVVCEDATEKWYIVRMRLLKEGTEKAQ